MKHLLTFFLALTCATLHAQSVIIKGTGAGSVRGTGADSVKGTATAAHTDYSDGRFTVWDANTNVVDDNDSGKTWTRNANVYGGTILWSNAVDYCDNLETNGYDDWRLPSFAELSRSKNIDMMSQAPGSPTGLADAYPSANNPALPLGHPFINIQSGDNYWSSSGWEGWPEVAAWNLVFTNGWGAYGGDKGSSLFYLWPCRGP